MTTDAFFYAGTYQFTVQADDEFVLIVDGANSSIPVGKGQSNKAHYLNLSMWYGNHHIEVLYRECDSDCVVFVNWSLCEWWSHAATAATARRPAAAACSQPPCADPVRRLHVLHPAEYPSV